MIEHIKQLETIQRAYKLELNPTEIQKLILNSIFECERAITNKFIEECHLYYNLFFDKNLDCFNRLFNHKLILANKLKKEIPEPISQEKIDKYYKTPFPPLPSWQEFYVFWNNIFSNEIYYAWMRHNHDDKFIKHYPLVLKYSAEHVVNSFKKFNTLSGGIFNKILNKIPLTFSAKQYKKLPFSFKKLLKENNNIVSYKDCYRFLDGCPRYKSFQGPQSFTFALNASTDIIHDINSKKDLSKLSLSSYIDTFTSKTKSSIRILCIRYIVDYLYKTPIEDLPKQYKKIKPLITKPVYESENIEYIKLKQNTDQIQKTAKLNNITIVLRPSGRYHAAIQADNVIPDPYIFPEKNEIIGIDLGLTKPIVTSNNEINLGPPKTTEKVYNHKKREQRALQRKRNFAKNKEKRNIINLILKSEIPLDLKKSLTKEINKYDDGISISKTLREKIESTLNIKLDRLTYSKRYEKNRTKIAKIEEHLSNIRNDHHAKYVHSLYIKYEAVKAEKLNIRAIGAHGGAYKKGFNRKWKFLAPGDLLRRLEYKAKWMGRQFYKVDPKNTSKMCSNCGEINDNIKGFEGLKIREFKCEKCGLEICRDLNAAINIRKAKTTDVQN